jgi:hypothetical protein
LGVAATLTVGLAAPLSAQMQSDNSKDKTKVYAYQKRLPETSPAIAIPKREAVTPSYASDEVPYGTQSWWREREQLTGGSGGE